MLGARHPGQSDADLLRHLRECSRCSELADVAESIGALGALRGAPSLPDPDWLWLRAQVLVTQEAAAKALWAATLRRALPLAALIVAAVWVALEWLAPQQVGLVAFRSTIASLAAEPLLNVAVSAFAALATAVVTCGLFFARPFLARQLLYAGLL
ncbi:MAG TPA: hypothetical protein VM509_13390 [Planctomycetota bacterium]|nr:hypothetical protein [Planctomycetota bacterium]